MSQADKAEREAWQAAPLSVLVHHLVAVCHEECRVDMARLETLVELEALEGGSLNLDFLEVRDMISRFCTVMRTHLALEERNLFPYVIGLGDGAITPAQKEALGDMRQLLEADHEAEAGMLRTIRGLTAAMATSPDPASPESRIHEALMNLSGHLQKHFYLENQVLFPRTR